MQDNNGTDINLTEWAGRTRTHVVVDHMVISLKPQVLLSAQKTNRFYFFISTLQFSKSNNDERGGEPPW